MDLFSNVQLHSNWVEALSEACILDYECLEVFFNRLGMSKSDFSLEHE